MGGRIWVESAPGKGSTFHFTAQLRGPHEHARSRAARRPEPAPGTARPRRRRRRDEPPHPRRHAARTGAERRARRDGLAAWGELEAAHAANRPFHLVLTDHLMPGLDGPGLADRIARDARFAALPVVMLSSSGLAGNAPARSATLAGYLIKPVTEAELAPAPCSTRARAAPPRRRPSPTARRRRRAGRALRVLVAEDFAINQKVVTRMLERLGHHARVVSDGRAALAALDTRRVRRRADGRADAGDGRPRGHAVDPGARGRDRQRDRARARGQRLRRSRPGARPHPHRRADRSRDEERRGALSRRRHGRLSLEARHGRGARPGPGALRARARRAGCWRHRSTSPLALRGIDGDVELLGELCALFVEEWPARQEELRSALHALDAARLERAAHGLKGVLGALGAGGAAAVAARARDTRAGRPPRRRARRSSPSSKVPSQRSSPSSPCPPGRARIEGRNGGVLYSARSS